MEDTRTAETFDTMGLYHCRTTRRRRIPDVPPRRQAHRPVSRTDCPVPGKPWKRRAPCS